MASGTPMSSGFQMVPAEVFGSGAQQAFIPGPMMMGMGYPMGMRPAMVKPVRRPITIQAPPDADSASGLQLAMQTCPFCLNLHSICGHMCLQNCHLCCNLHAICGPMSYRSITGAWTLDRLNSICLAADKNVIAACISPMNFQCCSSQLVLQASS